MKKLIRASLVVLTIFLVGMCLLSIRYFFDRRDRIAATNLVLHFSLPVESSITLQNRMSDVLQISPSDLFCEAEILSRYEKTARVECGRVLAHALDPATEHFLWWVDVMEKRVEPKNDLAKRLVDETGEESGAGKF